MKAGLFFSCTKIPLQKKTRRSFYHKVLRKCRYTRSYAKNCCPTFNFPAKKLRVIVVVRLIYVICTKDGAGGALAHTYYSGAAWPV